MATIAQIAAELGLSKSTVSRALRGVPGISAETIAQVTAAADRLGYVPSIAAAGLSTGRNHTVGVVVPSLNRWFYNSALTGITRTLADTPYDVILYDLDRPHGGGTRTFSRALLRQRVDAVITVATVFSAEELAEFAHFDVPMIAVGPPTAGLRTIGIDDIAIMSAATAHVVELGHRRLGLLGGFDAETPPHRNAIDREQAFMRTALAAGATVDPSWMLAGGYRVDSAIRAVSDLFRSPSRPTALVCASDDMAFGAMYALELAGLRVPQDVSVVSIDGHEYSEAYDLTTCRQDPEAQGVLAARAIVAEVEGAEPPASFPTAGFELVVRGSTAPPS